MPALSVADIVRATGGTLLRGDSAAVATSFAIDSRRVRRGGAFFALAGARVDGHRFVGEAGRQGAVVAVVERDLGTPAGSPETLVQVPSTPAALAACACAARERLTRTRFIGLTGSVGKTTTKDLIAAGLAATRRVHKTEGNLNNELGVPLTLLACPDDAEYAVIEMAMRGPGQIAELARWVRPDVGLVTAVRPAHLAMFRDLDDIAAAKGELYAVLPAESISVVNLDDPLACLQSFRHAGRRVTYGRGETADVRIERIEDRFVPGAELAVRIAGGLVTVGLRFPGAHAAINAAAALATIHAAGEPVGPAALALAAVEPPPGRGRVLDLGAQITLVDDTYNSNPAALGSVLETLRRSHPKGRKILVLGDMLELGPGEREYHEEAGRLAAAAGVTVLIAVGPLARAALPSARIGGVVEAHAAEDADRAAEILAERLAPGDLVVVKGSRGVALDRVVDALAARPAVEGNG